jgi:hypothetical protein
MDAMFPATLYRPPTRRVRMRGKHVIGIADHAVKWITPE